MAMECCQVRDSMKLVKSWILDKWTLNQLDTAINNLDNVAAFLSILEKRYPENVISTQLRPLFLEAHAGFSQRMIPKRLKIAKSLNIIKPENIAKRIKASKPSRSSSQITMEMVLSVEPLLYRPDLLLSLVYLRGHAPPVLSKKLQLLQLFLTLTANRCIDHESMKDLFTHVEDVAYTVAHLCFLGLAHNMDCEFSKLLERISPSTPELRHIYKSLLIASKSSRSAAQLTWRYLRMLVDAVKGDLQDLLSHDAFLKVAFDDKIPWLQQGLSYISGFLKHLASTSKCTALAEVLSLQSHIEALAIDAAIVVYSSYNEEMDNTIVALQLKLNQVKLEIDLIQLLTGEATIIAHLKDLSEHLKDTKLEEMIFLRTFLIDSLERCKEHTKITEFLALNQSLTRQAWSFVNSRSHDLAREINGSYFQLLLKFKFIMAAITRMCPDISASSTLDHPTIDLLNFLPINFEVIDSYFNMLKYARTSSSVRHNMDLVLMEFHEYILDNLLVKYESDLLFTVADEAKKFYDGLLLLVTYHVDPPFQCNGRKKQNESTKVKSSRSVHLTGFGTTRTEAKSWKVDLVLQFLVEAFKFVKILKNKATLKAQILDLTKIAHEELILLVAFLTDLLRQHTELTKFPDLLKCAEVTVLRLSQISGSFCESFMDGSSTEKMRVSLSDYVYVIKYVKVEVRKVCFQFLDASPCNMTDGEGLINFLLDHNDRMIKDDVGSIFSMKNQISLFKDKQVYLGSFLADIIQYRNMHQELKDLVKCLQDVMYVCLFPIRGYRPAWYYMLYLSDLKQLLNFVEAEVKMICLKVPDSTSYSFPKTNGLGFLDRFLGKLEDLLCSKIDSVFDLEHQIGSVKEGLLCLRSLTNHFPEIYNEHDEFYSLITSVTEMAYKAEYVTDSCLTCSHPLWYKVLWISEVVEGIKLVNKMVSDTCGRKEIDITVHKVANTSMNVAPSLSANTPRANEEMEGFHEAMEKIKEQLLRGSPELDIISIVGMPGIGKTTLAEKIYNDLIVTPYFDVHAKCRLTQVYSWKELLLTILNDVLEPADRTEKEDGELANELRQVLLTKRFLILIDDVWDKTAWDNLYMCFRDAQSGSRIILTTRLSDIANYVRYESNPHHLRLFRDDESWTLLQEEVFQGERCPPELVDVGFQIAKSCGGLPLFIVLVAGVLKEEKKEADVWKEVEDSLGSQSIGGLEESMSLIGFSYKNLPHHLKPCFLYFGGFLKGKDIHVSKLTRLWQAEGFVQAHKEKTTEDAAQDFFEDLISRNLLMAMEKRPNDKVKRCRIHDLLHNFCLEKAKQENFLNQINRGEDMLPEKPEDYRLFVNSYQDEIDLWRPCRSNVCSLQFEMTDPDNLLWPRDISFIFESFKLVKVLDLESFNIGGTFPSEVQSLIHLRYFAVQTDANSVPSFIAKLSNLETFVVRGLRGEVMLPCSLLKMVKLRHILVKHRTSFSLHEYIGESLSNSQLNDLQTFSSPRLSYGADAEAILTKMPNLRKLSCIFSSTFGHSEKVKGRCVVFPRLEFLSHLESLKLVSNSYPAKLPHEFNFPSQLRELTLSKFRLPWSEISIVGELPNLEILRLRSRAFEGNQWEVNDSEFPELKYLNLDNINISQWSVSDDAFPKLECLVLTKCKQLEEIPCHFGDAISIKSIEVNRCCWSVANSALEIQTTQHDDMANDAFTVTIQPPDWATRSSP